MEALEQFENPDYTAYFLRGTRSGAPVASAQKRYSPRDTTGESAVATRDHGVTTVARRARDRPRTDATSATHRSIKAATQRATAGVNAHARGVARHRPGARNGPPRRIVATRLRPTPRCGPVDARGPVPSREPVRRRRTVADDPRGTFSPSWTRWRGARWARHVAGGDLSTSAGSFVDDSKRPAASPSTIVLGVAMRRPAATGVSDRVDHHRSHEPVGTPAPASVPTLRVAGAAIEGAHRPRRYPRRCAVVFAIALSEPTECRRPSRCPCCRRPQPGARGRRCTALSRCHRRRPQQRAPRCRRWRS